MVGACKLQDVLYYKARAISEINKLLSNPKTMIDDCNITAVFMLLTLEEYQLAPGSRTGDDEDWSELQRSIHLNGLKTMISQRGGLAGLGTNRCLQVFILMYVSGTFIHTHICHRTPGLHPFPLISLLPALSSDTSF
jgi:hypothetical protein